MKKKVIYVILGIILGGILFGLGLFVGKEVLKDDEKVEKEEEVKETVKDENGYPEGFVITGYSTTDDYYIVSGYVSGDDYAQYMYVYDEYANLKASFVNASYMRKVMIGENVAYQVDIELGRGGAHSTTYVLNENLDIIVENDMLPEQFDGMDKDLFTSHYNSDGTISIMINDIYVYDYEGNLVKIIENKEDRIKALTKDYYLTNDNGKINLVRTDNGKETLVVNKKDTNIMYSPISGSTPLLGCDEDEEYFIYIMDGLDYETATCSVYRFKEKNGLLEQTGKDETECF